MEGEGFDYILFSDGGGQKGSAAAGACILESAITGVRHHVVVFLGGATNNEAEIFGGLAGFALLRALEQQSEAKERPSQIRWVCDSEYVLKSATQYIFGWQRNGWKTADKKPVKNQGLWRAFLVLSRGVKITANHVRGHTGHVENEACDAAATWAQSYGVEYLGRSRGVETVEIDDESWLLVDGRELLAELRMEHPEEAVFETMVATLSSAPPASADTRAAPDPDLALKPLLKQLKSIGVAAKGLASPRAQRLAEGVNELIRELS